MHNRTESVEKASVNRVGNHCVDKHSITSTGHVSLKEFSICWSIHVAKNKLSVSNSCLCGCCCCCCCCNYQLARTTCSHCFIQIKRESIKVVREGEKEQQQPRGSHKKQPFLVPDSIAKRTAPTHSHSFCALQLDCALIAACCCCSWLLSAGTFTRIPPFGTDNRSHQPSVWVWLEPFHYAICFHSLDTTLFAVILSISCHWCFQCEWMSKWWPLASLSLSVFLYHCTTVHLLKLIKYSLVQ